MVSLFWTAPVAHVIERRMKIVTMYLPDNTSVVDLHRAAVLLGCYVKPAPNGGLELRPITINLDRFLTEVKRAPSQNVVKFPSNRKPNNTPPSAA